MYPRAPMTVVRSAVLGLVILGYAPGAGAMTVTRCNVLSDGIYTPALVVENDGQTQVFRIGDNGLTRRILFNENEALTWALGVLGGTAVVATYADCSEDGGDNVVVAATPPAPPAPPAAPPPEVVAEPPPDEPEVFGGYGGYGEVFGGYGGYGEVFGGYGEYFGGNGSYGEVYGGYGEVFGGYGFYGEIYGGFPPDPS